MDDNARTFADERRRLVAELTLERNQLWRNIEWCRIRDIDRPFSGEWSLKDIVGHVASHEAEVVSSLRDYRSGHPVTYFEATAETDRWNADHVERKRGVDFWSLLEQLRNGRARLLEELEYIPDELLADETAIEYRLVRSVIDHDTVHWHDIAARVAGMEGARTMRRPESVASR